MATSTANSALAASLEAAINEAIKLDPAAAERFTGVTGKVIHIRCTAPEFDLYVMPAPDSIKLLANFEGKCDCSVSGPASEYLAMLSAEDKPSALINGALQVNGDTSPLLTLQEAVQNLDIDWEGRLAGIIGDVPAHQLGKALRSSAKWGRQAHNSLLRHVEEFIHEEARLAPSRAEVDDFFEDLRALDNQVERVAARARSLSRRISRNAKPEAGA